MMYTVSIINANKMMIIMLMIMMMMMMMMMSIIIFDDNCYDHEYVFSKAKLFFSLIYI